MASSPDPDDPDRLAQQLEEAKASERVVDERLDPYSARWKPREKRTESLARLVRNEEMVEGIVRVRSWGLVKERCGDEGVGLDEAFGRWREQEGR